MPKITSVNAPELGYSLFAAYIYLMRDEGERSDGREKRGRQAAIFRKRINELCSQYGYSDEVENGILPDDPNFLSEIDLLCRVYCALHKRK